MNLYNIKNIKDLPQLEQILPGNFMVVENFNGTNKLDFDDFVIGPRNTSFANQVFNDILSLSSYSISLSSTVTSQVTSLCASTSTLTSTLSSQVQYLSGQMSGVNNVDTTSTVIGLIKISKSSILVSTNSVTGSAEFTMPTPLTNLQNSDIVIRPSNVYSVSLLYAFNITSTVINNDNTTTYTVTLTTNTVDVSEERYFDMTVFTV